MKTQQSVANSYTRTMSSATEKPHAADFPGAFGTRLFPSVIVEQKRAGVIERCSEVQIMVVSRWGRLLAHFGGFGSDGVPVTADSAHHEAGQTAYLHDLAKLWQVLPLLDRGDDLTDNEIAIAVSTNLGEIGQRRAIESLLRLSGASPLDLRVCGRDPLASTDAGIHAALLLSCVRNGWAKHGYCDPSHPVQLTIRSHLAAALGVAEDTLVSTPDENGLPTFGFDLKSIADLVRKIPERVLKAVQRNPHLSGGLDQPDTDLMVFQRGWFAKAASEGLFVARHDSGLTIVLKVVNADSAAIRPAFAKVLDVLCGADGSAPSTHPPVTKDPIRTLLRGAANADPHGVVWTASELGVNDSQLADLTIASWRTSAVRTSRGEQVGTIEAREVSFERSRLLSDQQSGGVSDLASSTPDASTTIDSAHVPHGQRRLPLGISLSGERFDRHEIHLADVFAPLTPASLHDTAAPTEAARHLTY